MTHPYPSTDRSHDGDGDDSDGPYPADYTQRPYVTRSGRTVNIPARDKNWTATACVIYWFLAQFLSALIVQLSYTDQIRSDMGLLRV